MRRIIIAVISSLSLAQAAQADESKEALAPGLVGQAHADIGGQCDSCHLVFAGVPDQKCLKCHEDISTLMSDARTFHARKKDTPCIHCHTDHQGRDAHLTLEKALAQFDHDETRYPLRGAHTRADCTTCHNQPIQQTTADCTTCHEDTHKGGLGNQCGTCHMEEDWRAELKTASQHETRMDGGHSTLTCQDCHLGGENLAPQVDCKSCHPDPHGGTQKACNDCHTVSGFTPAKFEHEDCTCRFPGKHQTFPCLSCHENFKFADTTLSCQSCHAQEQPHTPMGECGGCHSAMSWKEQLFDHNADSAFKLDGRHPSVDCQRCHLRPGMDAQATPDFGAAPSTCYGCHAEEGMKVHGDFGACETCHTTETFSPATFDHASTGFPITGRHEKLDCLKCHARATTDLNPKTPAPVPSGSKPPKPRRKIDATKTATTAYREGDWGVQLAAVSFDQNLFLLAFQASHERPSTSSTAASGCVRCHTDPHQNPEPAACETCHETGTWTKILFTAQDHAQTLFPLEGKHIDASCTDCHIDQGLRGVAIPKLCSGCHMDPHQNKFGNACASCHTTTSFTPAGLRDHSQTGFPLLGAHPKNTCADCHEGTNGKALTKSKEPQACQTCHAQGHGNLGTDCAQCHLSKDTTFDAARGRPTFDHNNTIFPLERRHNTIACKSCHPTGADTPTTRCASCHVDPHTGQLGQQCGDCHKADRWRLARFDHDQTGWPLRGRHFVTPCASCHTNQRWVGLSTECWDCHALTAARSNSLNGFHVFSRRECQRCHLEDWGWP